MRRLLEICTADIDSVKAAAAGGADRIELCSALSDGGITPSVGLIKAALKIPGIKVNVLIRPRGGDFLYNEDEVQIMEEDIRRCRELGVNGVVIGALTEDGDVDMDICQRLMDAAGNLEVTFHRAFDVCRNPKPALEEIISLGCSRLLTSGHSDSAMSGIEMLGQLVKQSSGRISIMPGGGVNPGNAAQIVLKCGASEIHGSAKAPLQSKMKYRVEGVNMGNQGVDEYLRVSTSEILVKQIRASLDSI